MGKSKIELDDLQNIEDFQKGFQDTLNELRVVTENKTAHGSLNNIGETFAQLGMFALTILNAQEALLDTYKKLYGNLTETELQGAINEATTGNYGSHLGRTRTDS
ncbi:MAG: hypothetical protein JKY98_07860 [Gammaproteobacteria bacterium]|nr:hypothetical protein [Gammaproteobacteria bacterium]